MSCKKAWAALEKKKIEIQEEVNAAKETIGGDEVWELLKGADRLVVASGKKILSFDTITERDEILAKVSGRTGNLRAPTLKVGNTYYIGYNEELYNEHIQ